jgi:hypothetical protein
VEGVNKHDFDVPDGPNSMGLPFPSSCEAAVAAASSFVQCAEQGATAWLLRGLLRLSVLGVSGTCERGLARRQLLRWRPTQGVAATTTEAVIPGGGCCRGASMGMGAGGREELLLAGGGEGEGHHGAPWARAGGLTKLRVARAPRDEGGCAGRPFLPIYLRPGSWQRRGGGRGVVSKAGVGARHGCQT